MSDLRVSIVSIVDGVGSAAVEIEGESGGEVDEAAVACEAGGAHWAPKLPMSL